MVPLKDWHAGTAAEVLEALGASTDGLSEEQAAERLAERGPNELSERSGKRPLRMLAEQFLQTMVLIPVAAALVSAVLGKVTESAAILVIVVLAVRLESRIRAGREA
jgi:P-type Ca2+ transporter type 2C